MEPNLEQTLSGLKRQVSELKNQKIRIEAEMAHLVSEKQDILKEANGLGVDVKQLDHHINELESDILSQIQILERNLDECGSEAKSFTE